MDNVAFTDYANLTEEIKAEIIRQYEYARSMKATTEQAVAIAAHAAYRLTDRQWNGKIGSNAFASACAVLVMSGHLGSC
jgi:hypothetical protein